jgi:hypothetical protein
VNVTTHVNVFGLLQFNSSLTEYHGPGGPLPERLGLFGLSKRDVKAPPVGLVRCVFCIYTSFALIFLILVYHLLIRKIATLSLRASSNNPKPIFVFLLLFTNLQSCGVDVSLFLQTEFVSSNGIVKSKETIREKNLYNLIVSNKW